MAPYFILLSVPSLLAVFIRRRINVSLFVTVFLFFTLFIGLRFRVGMDWNNYSAIHEFIGFKNVEEILFDSEPASFLLFWLSTYLMDSMLFSNIVSGCLLLIGVFAMARRTANPWLSLVSATPYLIIAFGMTGIRQAIGVGIILYLLSVWERTNTFTRCIVILIASLFHTSALIGGLIILAELRINLIQKLMIGASVLALGFGYISTLLFYRDNIEFYQDAYLSGEDSIISPGALMHVAMVWVPAVAYLVMRKRLLPVIFNSRLMDIGSVFTILLLVVYFISSTIASRLTLYLYFVPMMFYPAFVLVWGERSRVALTFLVVLMHFILLAVWLEFANNSTAHIPYRNVIFEETFDLN